MEKKWKERRYALYRLTGDKTALRSLAEELLFDGDVSYYDQLKEMYPSELWPKRREEYFERLKRGTVTRSAYLAVIIKDADRPPAYGIYPQVSR